MGAWGFLAFENDATNDWAESLEDVDDLSLVIATFDELEEDGIEYLDEDIACDALGACEVLARLLGNPGYNDSYTEKVDRWVAAHKIAPPPELLKRARAALDRILADESELRDLWEDSEDAVAWRESIEDLRARLKV